MAAQPLAFQDAMPGNHCWGCGAGNDLGFQIKSFWEGDEAICRFQALEHHAAWPSHVLNGGVISTVIDCHCICTAIAAAYRAEGREIGEGELIVFATGSLNVSFKLPTPIDQPLVLRAAVTQISDRRINVSCTLSANGTVCATGEVATVRVSQRWLDQSTAKGSA